MGGRKESYGTTLEDGGIEEKHAYAQLDSNSSKICIPGELSREEERRTRSGPGGAGRKLVDSEFR